MTPDWDFQIELRYVIDAGDSLEERAKRIGQLLRPPDDGEFALEWNAHLMTALRVKGLWPPNN